MRVDASLEAQLSRERRLLRGLSVLETETIVIGAGPAGLACAAALQRLGRSATVLDAADQVGSSWRRHYDRLHLHTPKKQSGLPGLPMPKHYPKYPSRDHVIAYLDAYVAHHKVPVRLKTSVVSVRKEGSCWRVQTNTEELTSENVVFATGMAGQPIRPVWPGLETFPGRILHSSEYTNPSSFPGCRALVVGFGNSGAEIALDLCDAGNHVCISARSPVNVVPRDLLGIPILTLAILQRSLPYSVVDAINAPILRLFIGDTEKFGLCRSPKGPMAQVVEDRRIPVLDVGTMDRIRRGEIKVRPQVIRSSGVEVRFEDGTEGNFDVIVQATGYRPKLRSLIPDHQDAIDASETPIMCGRRTSHAGLFFCGYVPVSTGQFREIGIEAIRIAGAISGNSQPR